MEYAPYGDFADLVLEKKIHKDEILSRTFFHHLIEGTEYLHSKGMAHMDLKLENLLLGEDYKLKIADFDLSYIEGDKEVRSRGTCHYRAPEVLNKCTRIPKRADLYSLGIILFIFKTGGFPCLEDVLIEGHNLNELMLNDDSQFWKVHKKIQNKNVVLDQDFKDLFMSLVKRNSSKRASLEDIKKSKWYNGPIYRDCEMVSRLAELCIFKAQEEVAED
jgi:serine/threonine protein kinase